jgi:predicted phosphohydrolase
MYDQSTIKKMNNQDFTTTILVDQSPKEAYDAIVNVRGWWSENIKGSTDKLNEEFTYSAKDLHRCTMKMTEAMPGKKAVWLVLDNYFNFTKDQREWDGTNISFDISEKDGKTQIKFAHNGLVPGMECYQICENAWSGYINNSLRDLITTGKGQPNEKED